MPDPKQRKQLYRDKRNREKYIDIPHNKHPHRFYPANKKDTATLMELFKTRNYVKIFTQIQDNLYIIQQHYLFCDSDLWACGDGIVLNVNPDKKILVQPMCILTRRECICYHESTREFLTMCPKCFNIQPAVKDTYWKCNDCKFDIKYNQINDAPYLKLQCEFCPVEIGWGKVKVLNSTKSEFYKRLLKVRSCVAARLQEKHLADVKSEFEKEDIDD